ncbi:restriction endonuclease [Desulfobotulus mexicanus]|uniref:Restriction endonuclease n=1 Tax=Desulfobotulus mexicanus TaxID=2586642 RepID=A0A5Q4VDZ0_9BACT|nr:restriction endonuclease [Desulfobotulus mexicanus]TYT74617.1 restriction endonuclease [Desulfobotulus mexicanus]
MLDFSEIKDKDGQSFENLICSLLSLLGYKILKGPGIGQDRGADIIVEESVGNFDNGYRWLVSCKHYTGSVGQGKDGADARKLTEFRCHGFMFFYSSSITESLQQSLSEVAKNSGAGLEIYNGFQISNLLLTNVKCYPLLHQFFPVSSMPFFNTLFRPGEDYCDHCGPYRSHPAFFVFSQGANGKIDTMLVCCDCIALFMPNYPYIEKEYSYYQIRDCYY